ncbi:MAG TPA: DUF2059 domain-containing protein [Usitatibacter sp.]|nr:DUF2059 domain-containing protein [Usitatibacter sp.]
MGKRLLSMWLVLASSLALAAPPDPARIDELMHKSGLWTQVGAMQEQVRAGSSAARRQERSVGPQAMTEAEFEKLAAVTEAAFAPERARKATAAFLARELSAEEVDAMLAWLSSPLGERCIRAEEAVAGADPAALQRDARAVVEALSPQRRALLERFVAAVHSDEMAVNMMGNMANAVVYGAAAMTPGDDADEAIRLVKKKAEANRPRLIAFFREFMFAQAAWTYRELADEDLERYVTFNESPVGRRLNDAAGRAIDHVVVQAALEIGRSIGADAGRKARRS